MSFASISFVAKVETVVVPGKQATLSAISNWILTSLRLMAVPFLKVLAVTVIGSSTVYPDETPLIIISSKISVTLKE